MKNKYKDNLKKIVSYLKDSDVRYFLVYSMLHPVEVIKFNPFKGVYSEKEKLEGVKCYEDTFQLKRLKTYHEEAVDCKDLERDRYWNIHLAGLDYYCDVLSIDWSASFNDFEDETSLHRFVWLYRAVMDNYSHKNKKYLNKFIKKIIKSWIKDPANDIAKNRYTVWQTYTVAERLISWTIVLSLTNEDKVDEEIDNSIRLQLKYIKDHIEYHGDRFTGGHLCNDGRGLYIAGSLTGNEGYAELGRIILSKELEELLVDKYFHREGSTHYSFLYCKWLTDLFWVAESTNDKLFSMKIKKLLKRSLRGCQQFLYKQETSEWNIPYIGDISPDYQPAWIMGTPWVAKLMISGSTFDDVPDAKGYHSFFINKTDVEYGNYIVQNHMPLSRDWAKIQNQMFVIFGHVNNSMYPNNVAGHFHHDSGGIVIIYKGMLLLQDAGRKNYCDSRISEVQDCYKGHNLLVIDKKNPEINMTSFYTDKFLKTWIPAAPAIYKNKNGIFMKIDYTKRIAGVKYHKRSVYLKQNQVEIIDRISGSGIHDVELYYHISKEFKVIHYNKNGVDLRSEKENLRISFDMLPDRIVFLDNPNTAECHVATEYGGDQDCSVIVYAKKGKFPFEIKTKITALNTT